MYIFYLFGGSLACIIGILSLRTYQIRTGRELFVDKVLDKVDDLLEIVIVFLWRQILLLRRTVAKFMYRFLLKAERLIKDIRLSLLKRIRNRRGSILRKDKVTTAVDNLEDKKKLVVKVEE